MPAARTRVIDAGEIFIKSALPDTDYVANPYVGCRFGCSYCYASFMGRFVGETVSAWGDYVYVKQNAVAVGRSQLARWAARNFAPSILFSSVTDPYQGAERKFRLTRGLLGALLEADYRGRISILTKSPLVLRDADLLGALRDAEVGLTITADDDKLSRILEMRAPAATSRLNTLKRLIDRGLRTYVFLGPLLPHYAERPERLEGLLRAVADTGTASVYVEELNLSPRIRARYNDLNQQSARHNPQSYEPHSYERFLVGIEGMLAKHGLRLRMGQVLRHRQDRAAASR